MNLIINSSSMVPIYEQIVESFKKMIASGELVNDEMLPSVRTLSNELRISALTVKKAYDRLEEEGFTVTVHGKGTFVKSFNPELLKEEQMKEIENDLSLVLEKAKRYGIEPEEIKNAIDLLSSEI
ncbi:MAG: GntR family transcriptional regulator [Lachnospiraceae bacterium]|nr:GntR family transcriptional regulator [Lachnospiraceae bacterium]